MKNILLLASAFCLASHGLAQTVSEKIETYCKAAAATGRLHGYVLVKQNGRVLHSAGYGYCNYAEKSVHTAQTRFQVGSVTKQFTAALVLQLQQEGRLTLNDKLSVYFPGFPQAGRVTIEQLLTHTSGIFNYTNNRQIFDSLRHISVTPEGMVNLLASLPYEFEPGTGWSYSNSAYSLLGYIIEKVTGKSWEQNIRERIFLPLGMQSSGFDYKSAAPEKATGYYLLAEDNQVMAAIIDSSVSYAAGAIYTTPAGLLQWNEYLLEQYRKQAPWLINAWTPRKNKYGLGWFVDTIHGKPAIHHGGAIDGFNAQNILLPLENTTITIMLNAEMYDADRMARDLAGILQGAPVAIPQTPAEISLDPAVLQQYTGIYQAEPGMKITVSLQNKHLLIAPEGQPPARLYPLSQNEFFFKIMDARIAFLKNAEGKVEKLVFKQDGQSMEAKKTE